MSKNEPFEPVDELIDISAFDGREHPYIPPTEFDTERELDIPGDVSLHDDVADSIDPISYEVIRHRLHNINEQHGETIQTLAVSNVTMETRDFQTAINDANGDFIYFGPYLQTFAGFLDLNIKWILENRSDDPGIHPGDVFIHNDPWIGITHQPDVVLLCPVFHEGELFCWVSNIMHQSDLGGVAPGSWCQNAEDRFWESPTIPPIKIVERGEINTDIIEMIQRFSRTPQAVGLDLRAGITGNTSSRKNIKDLLEKYGTDTVRKGIEEVSDQSEEKFTSLLQRVPDGKWQTRSYQEVSKPGDRGTYKVQVQLEKRGDTLRFTSDGSDPSTGVISVTHGVWRGAVINELNQMLIPEQMGAIGGIREHVDVVPNKNSLMCARPNASVSASQYGVLMCQYLANKLISQMLLSSQDEEIRARATTPEKSQWLYPCVEGTNERGEYIVGASFEGIIGSGQATPYKDGDFANGIAWIPEGQGPNVEANERNWPILYLYRRELADSGGDGYRRGGNGGDVALMAHKGEDTTLSIFGNEVVPKTLGLAGGGPGSRHETTLIKESDVQEQFADGTMPGDSSEVAGTRKIPPGKGVNEPITSDDIVKRTWTGIGGYGDPLDREPDRVAGDVRDGVVTADVAREKYGVVLNDDGTVDSEATTEAREQIRETRLAESTIGSTNN